MASLVSTTVINSTPEYLSINSTHRDRTVYPNPCNFALDIRNTRTVIDPIANAVPFLIYDKNSLIDASSVQLVGGSFGDNYYINDIVEVWDGVSPTSEERKISSFDTSTGIATVSPPFSFAVSAMGVWLKRAFSSEFNVLQAGSATTVQLAASPKYTDYVNKWMIVRQTLALDVNYNYSRIIAYDPLTQIARVDPAFETIIPAAGWYYSISDVVDNYRSLQGTMKAVDPEIYYISIPQLYIPDTTLYCGTGGTIVRYPYVYLHIGNRYLTSADTSSIITNEEYPGVFKIPTSQLTTTSNGFFYLLDCGMTVPVRFTIREVLYFTLFLPSGEILKFAEDDMSPFPPNPALQISCVISMYRGCWKSRMIKKETPEFPLPGW